MTIDGTYLFKIIDLNYSDNYLFNLKSYLKNEDYFIQFTQSEFDLLSSLTA